MKTIKFPNGSRISADNIEIGKEFQIGANVNIAVRNTFKIGDFGRFGDNVNITAENVIIGKHFFHYTPGLSIGGGGSQFSEAVFTVGDRCVLHNNYINLARTVSLGNDVGLSPDVDIITHGFWNSVLEGYPTKYDGVLISDGVIVGQRSFILPGVFIAVNAVIGANSTVSKSLNKPKSVYAGNPAKFIKEIVEPDVETKNKLMGDIINKYLILTKNTVQFEYSYPLIKLEHAVINVEKCTIEGTETKTTDKLRDFLRRYGIRIYTERGFISL